MKKRIVGCVDEPRFGEAFDLLKAAPGRATLFVHCGGSEKVIHVSPSRVCVLLTSERASVPPDSPLHTLLCSPASGASESGDSPPSELPEKAGRESADPGYVEAAALFISEELREARSWKGALFELLEGKLPASVLTDDRFLEIRCPASAVLSTAGTDDDGTVNSADAVEPCFPEEPQARLEQLYACLPGAFGKQVLLRELAEVWRELGILSRAAQCLREGARCVGGWGLEDAACALLEEALQLCPVDLSAAEDALVLYQSAGKQGDAERVAETVFSHLEKLKRYEEIARFYRLLQRTPVSVALRTLGGESLFRQGETAAGINELCGAARSLEARSDPDGAAAIYERVLEMDSSSEVALEHLQALRRRQCSRRRLVQWGSLVAAAVLTAAWICWDLSAASAFATMEDGWREQDPRESVQLVRGKASGFPVSRHASRLARLEDELSEKGFLEDLSLLRRALQAQTERELEQARDLFAAVLENTRFPPLATRAELGRREVLDALSRKDSVLDHAHTLLVQKKYKEAFAAYREILLEDRHEASGDLVPVQVETVPAGARSGLRLPPLSEETGSQWVLLPPDPEQVMLCSCEGFRTVTIEDPVGGLLESGNPKLRIVLELERDWETRSGGGLIAEQVDPTADVVPVLGADGVLRGLALDPRDKKQRVSWSQPVQTDTIITQAPRVAGPAVIVRGVKGVLFGYSQSSGKLAWTARPGSGDSPVILGPGFAGQILSVAADGAVLLNPFTGLATRRLQLGDEKPAGPVTVVGELGVIALAGGGLACVDLRSGQLEFVRDRQLQEVHQLIERQGVVVVHHGDGFLTGLAIREADPLWETRPGPEFTQVCETGSHFICLGSQAGTVLCINARDGTTLRPSSVAGSLGALSGQADGGEILYAHVARDGKRFVTALSPRNNRVLWELETGPEELTSVYAIGPHVVVSTPTCGIVVARQPGT